MTDVISKVLNFEYIDNSIILNKFHDRDIKNSKSSIFTKQLKSFYSQTNRNKFTPIPNT